LSTNFPEDDLGSTDWISQAEASRIQGVTRQAIHKLVQSGRLKSRRVGGHVLVSRMEVVSFRPQAAGRPANLENRNLKRAIQLLKSCDQETTTKVLEFLEEGRPKHSIETRLGVSREVILEALSRASDLTLRMFRGVIAEAAFEIHVVKRLVGWASEPETGNPPYDFLLSDATGSVRVQVKLQRSTGQAPLVVEERFVVETQRTRGGQDRATGVSTRPYRFGQFDILAVSMQPSTRNWESFRYTVANWLLPRSESAEELSVFQPVALAPDEDWTDDFATSVAWFRSGLCKTIRGKKLTKRGRKDQDLNR